MARDIGARQAGLRDIGSRQSASQTFIDVTNLTELHTALNTTATGGEIIRCAAGSYGDLEQTASKTYSSEVTVRPAAGAAITFTSWLFDVISGIHITVDGSSGGTIRVNNSTVTGFSPIVEVRGASDGIRFTRTEGVDGDFRINGWLGSAFTNDYRGSGIQCTQGAVAKNLEIIGVSIDTCFFPLSFSQVTNLDIENVTGHTFRRDFGQWSFINSDKTGIASTALVAGRHYRITTAGTTTWTGAGAPDDLVDTVFTATGTAAGTGLATQMSRIENCTAYNFFGNLNGGPTPIGDGTNSDGDHADFIQIHNNSGLSPATQDLAIVGNQAIQNDKISKGDTLGPPSLNVGVNGGSFQGIFIEDNVSSPATTFDGILISNNFLRTDIPNTMSLENLANARVVNNTCVKRPNSTNSTSINFVAGLSGDNAVNVRANDNICNSVVSSHASGVTIPGNIETQGVQPNATLYERDLFVDGYADLNTKVEVDPRALVRHPTWAAGAGSGKGATTREADFAPVLYVDRTHKSDIDALEVTFICKVFSTNLEASGATDFNWDFDDGTTLSGVDASPLAHTYAAAGIYKVTCTRISDGEVGTYHAVVTNPLLFKHEFNNSIANEARPSLGFTPLHLAAGTTAGGDIADEAVIAWNPATGTFVTSPVEGQAIQVSADRVRYTSVEDLLSGSPEITISYHMRVDTLTVGHRSILAPGFIFTRIGAATQWQLNINGTAESWTVANFNDATDRHYVFQVGLASRKLEIDGADQGASTPGTTVGPLATNESTIALDIGDGGTTGGTYTIDQVYIFWGLVDAADVATKVALLTPAGASPGSPATGGGAFIGTGFINLS